MLNEVSSLHKVCLPGFCNKIRNVIIVVCGTFNEISRGRVLTSNLLESTTEQQCRAGGKV